MQAAGVVGRDVGMDFEQGFYCGAAGESGVLRGKNRIGEEAPANHDSGEFRVACLDVLDLLEVGDVDVKNQRELTFAVEFVKSLKVECTLVLLDSNPRMKRNVGERRII